MLNTLVLCLKTVVQIRVLQFLIWQPKKMLFHERNSCKELLACHSIKYTYLNWQEYGVFIGSACIISTLKQLRGFNSMAASLSVHIHLACSLKNIIPRFNSCICIMIQLFVHFVEKPRSRCTFLCNWRANNVVLVQPLCLSAGFQFRDVQCPNQSNWI